MPAPPSFTSTFFTRINRENSHAIGRKKTGERPVANLSDRSKSHATDLFGRENTIVRPLKNKEVEGRGVLGKKGASERGGSKE